MSQRKPIQTALLRLQCVLLRLQKYDYTIKYIPGKNMVLVDRLSWFPSQKNNTPIEIHQNIQHIHFNYWPCLNVIRGATEKEPVHATVYRLTIRQMAWQNEIMFHTYCTCHLWGTRDELTIKEGILKATEFVFLLSCMRGPSMTYMTATKASSRWHMVYWPGIHTDILDYIRHCTICARYKASQTVQPMLPRYIPDGPWQNLAADYFTHHSKDYLLITDSFSKYPSLFRVHSKTSDSLIQFLKTSFYSMECPNEFSPIMDPLFVWALFQLSVHPRHWSHNFPPSTQNPMASLNAKFKLLKPP